MQLEKLGAYCSLSSSFDGALMEIGPVRVDTDGEDGPKLMEAETTWSEYADVLYSKSRA